MKKYSNILYNNLIKTYNEFNTIIVCYDFDSTVYDYKSLGTDYSDVINTIKRSKRLGCSVYVYTDLHVSTVSILEEYLINNSIPYDSINECPIKIPFDNNGKPYYNILLDDKAGLDNSLEILTKVLDYIEYGRNNQTTSSEI